MVRQYVQVTDEQRRELVRLIHDENYSIPNFRYPQKLVVLTVAK